MRLLGRLLLMASMALVFASAASAQGTTGWTLVWNDEFNGASLDTSKWSAANNCGDQRNGEQQCYMADDVSVANGVLTIKSERRSQSGFSFTSGAVRTSTKFTQAYGRFEFSAALPAGGQGVWPALWLYPTNQWPPEIDVLEAVNDMRTIYMTYHWGSSSAPQQDGSAVGITNPSTQNHIYAVEWEPGEIRWYIDSTLVKTHSGSDVSNVPMQVYINTALGGSWPGSVAASTVFPQQMTIDYVRVYTAGGDTPADTTAPTVTLTAPTASISLSGTTTLSASASDNVGVASVWFTVDGATVGAEDTAAPYTTSWATTLLSNGIHVIRAMARDAAGNVGSSTTVSVTLANLLPDLVAPTVSLTAPTGGSTVSGTVTLAATASDNVGVVGVQFTVDGSAVGAEDTTAPFTYSWPTTSSTNGTRVIRAVARDAAGNTTTSNAVTVTVANTPSDTTMPTVSVTAPTSGTTVSGTVTVAATATDNTAIAGVRFTLDGTTLGTEDTVAPYSLSWTTTAATNGTHTVRAVARDTAGNTTTSGSVLVTVNNTSSDTTAPTVSLTAPASNATVSGTTSVSASASDNIGVVGVQFTLDGVNLGAEDTVAPYTILWTTTGATNGTHTLRALARDAAGNTRTATARTVTVSNSTSDTAAPNIAFTAPAANATVAGTVTLTVSASDNLGVVGVQFVVDGVNVGAEDTSAPYTRTWSASGELNGPHVLSATARDAAGNRRTTSATVTLRNLGSGVDGDLNDDRVPDLLFEHTNGQLYTWLMTGSTMTGQSPLAPGAVNPIWHVVALDDFDGDRKTDILWQNTVDGEVYLWLMDQGTLVDDASILADPTPWRVMGTADLNGDGKPDILWKQPTTGELGVWYMNGATFVGSASLGQVDPNWRLAGTTDLNKDGRPDFVWQNRATGQLAYWLMNGAALQQAGIFTPGATNVLWEVRAVADFDRDGQTDLIFQHATTGQLYIWYLNGTTLVRDNFLSPAQVDPNWRVVGGK